MTGLAQPLAAVVAGFGSAFPIDHFLAGLAPPVLLALGLADFPFLGRLDLQMPLETR